MIHFRIRYERLRLRQAARRRRIALARGLLVGFMPILAGVAWATFGPRPVGLGAWLVAAAVAAVAATLWLARPRDLVELGKALDRQFGLDDLLVTAVEVDRHGPASSIEEHLLDDAASALAQLEHDPRLEGHEVRREVEAVVGLALIVAGLALVGETMAPLRLPARLPDLALARAESFTGGKSGTPAVAAQASVGTATPTPERQAAEAPPRLATAAPRQRPVVAPSTLDAAGAGVVGRAAAGPAQGVAGGASASSGGGGSAAGAAPAGLPWEHSETVRRYFEGAP